MNKPFRQFAVGGKGDSLRKSLWKELCSRLRQLKTCEVRAEAADTLVSRALWILPYDFVKESAKEPSEDRPYNVDP